MINELGMAMQLVGWLSPCGIQRNRMALSGKVDLRVNRKLVAGHPVPGVHRGCDRNEWQPPNPKPSSVPAGTIRFIIGCSASIAFQIFTTLGRVIKEAVTVAGFTIFGALIGNDLRPCVDFFPAIVANVGFWGIIQSVRGRILMSRHAFLHDVLRPSKTSEVARH